MFKKIIAKTGVLIISAVLAVSANAGMIIDVVNQHVKVSCSGFLCLKPGVHNYTHNVLDDGFVLGSALSANLMINIYDDGDRWGEGAVIIVEDFDFDTGGAWGTLYGSAASGWANDLEINALAELNDDGMIGIKIVGTGDFWVGDSKLTVVTDVAEPGSMALLGLGLLGLGLARRRVS